MASWPSDAVPLERKRQMPDFSRAPTPINLHLGARFLLLGRPQGWILKENGDICLFQPCVCVSAVTLWVCLCLCVVFGCPSETCNALSALSKLYQIFGSRWNSLTWQRAGPVSPGLTRLSWNPSTAVCTCSHVLVLVPQCHLTKLKSVTCPRICHD